MSENLKRTPLFEAHLRHAGRMVPYAGWEMPVQYVGIIEETRAVRNNVGIFDISHMGRVWFSGPGAMDLLQVLTANDVSKLGVGQGHYSLLTNPEGGVIDDIIVYRFADETYLVVINAGNHAKDVDWFRSHSGSVEIDVASERTAMVAVQGPNAVGLLSRWSGGTVDGVGRFHIASITVGGVDILACRTGYTGEDGFELIIPAENADAVWAELVSLGALPAGLGARDTLRIEAGYPLYGHEIDDTTNPVEAGLMWVVKLDKGAFTGSERIAAVKAVGPSRKLVGVVTDGKMIPRQGYNLYLDDQIVGEITSGAFSPTRGVGLGMAYVDSGHSIAGTGVEIEIRGKRVPATIVLKKNLLIG